MKFSLLILILVIFFLIGYLISPYIYKKVRYGAIKNTNEIKRKLNIEYNKLNSIENNSSLQRKEEIQKTLENLNGVK